MHGYWNNPEDTKSAFRNGMFRTGDVGYQSADGYFFLLDRIKDMIVTGGENVYCGEVEAVIDEHPSGARSGGFWNTRSAMGRTRDGLRGAEAWKRSQCGRANPALSAVACELQDSTPHRVFSKASCPRVPQARS